MDFSKLIFFNENGINIPSYENIKSEMVELAKDVYGTDIEFTEENSKMIELLSSLVYNPILMLKTLYSSLTPENSFGNILNFLCELDGVKRHKPECSVVYANVKYIGDLDFSYGQIIKKGLDVTTQRIELKDEEGNLWIWEEGASYTRRFATEFPKNGTVRLPFVCDKTGETNCYIEDLRFNNVDYFEIVGTPEVYLGNSEETDEELKSRRLKELGGDGNTTYAGLMTSLLELDEIEDVLIYDNCDKSSGLITNGDFTVPIHKIFVIIKLKALADENTELEMQITKLIFNKLTSGISAIIPTSYDTRLKKGQRIINNEFNLTQDVYWALPLEKNITLNLKVKFKYEKSKLEVYKSKIHTLISTYLKKMKLSDSLVGQKLINYLNSNLRQYGFFFEQCLITYKNETSLVLKPKDAIFKISDNISVSDKQNTVGAYYNDYTITI